MPVRAGERGIRRVLILTRRVGESIMIGESVEVKVLGLRAGQIRIGVDAPADVTVHREEIYLRILDERKTSNQAEEE